MNNKEVIKFRFPKLSDKEFEITSPCSVNYNCIAWAAGDTEKWWWPDLQYTMYWPEDIKREESLKSFIILFERFSFVECKSLDLEENFEKVIIYVNNEGKPTHAARQLETGIWSSKLGRFYDISHNAEGLEGQFYGSIGAVLKRKIDT